MAGEHTLAEHTMMHTYTPNQCPYEVSSFYTLQNSRARTRFKNPGHYDKVNQGHTMTLHTYNPQPMYLPSINFLHLTVSEI